MRVNNPGGNVENPVEKVQNPEFQNEKAICWKIWNRMLQKILILESRIKTDFFTVEKTLVVLHKITFLTNLCPQDIIYMGIEKRARFLEGYR